MKFLVLQIHIFFSVYFLLNYVEGQGYFPSDNSWYRRNPQYRQYPPRRYQVKPRRGMTFGPAIERLAYLVTTNEDGVLEETPITIILPMESDSSGNIATQTWDSPDEWPVVIDPMYVEEDPQLGIYIARPDTQPSAQTLNSRNINRRFSYNSPPELYPESRSGRNFNTNIPTGNSAYSKTGPTNIHPGSRLGSAAAVQNGNSYAPVNSANSNIRQPCSPTNIRPDSRLGSVAPVSNIDPGTAQVANSGNPSSSLVAAATTNLSPESRFGNMSVHNINQRFMTPIQNPVNANAVTNLSRNYYPNTGHQSPQIGITQYVNNAGSISANVQANNRNYFPQASYANSAVVKNVASMPNTAPFVNNNVRLPSNNRPFYYSDPRLKKPVVSQAVPQRYFQQANHFQNMNAHPMISAPKKTYSDTRFVNSPATKPIPPKFEQVKHSRDINNILNTTHKNVGIDSFVAMHPPMIKFLPDVYAHGRSRPNFLLNLNNKRSNMLLRRSTTDQHRASPFIGRRMRGIVKSRSIIGFRNPNWADEVLRLKYPILRKKRHARFHRRGAN